MVCAATSDMSQLFCRLYQEREDERETILRRRRKKTQQFSTESSNTLSFPGICLKELPPVRAGFSRRGSGQRIQISAGVPLVSGCRGPPASRNPRLSFFRRSQIFLDVETNGTRGCFSAADWRSRWILSLSKSGQSKPPGPSSAQTSVWDALCNLLAK